MSLESVADQSAQRRRLGRWLLDLGEFALAQGFGQGVGMLAGLIYVRWMPKEEYALYALCLTTLAFVSVGSDLGINGSLNYFWRRALQDRRPFGPILSAARKMRSVLFAGALVVGGTMLFTSAGIQAMPTKLVCFGLVGATAFLALNSGIGIQVMRLEGRQRLSYFCEAAGNSVRLTTAASIMVTGLNTAWLGLAGGLLGALATQGLIQYTQSDTLRGRHTVATDHWREMRSYLLPLFPSVIVYVIQDPLIYWLTATRIGATTVADLFALGRIGVIFSTLGMFTYVVLTPRLSRITDNARFLKISALSFSAICLLAALALLAAWLAPDALLLLLGSQYADLKSELLIAMAAASTTILSSFLVLIARVQGWVRLDPFFALWQFMAIIVLCATWRFDSTRMVLELNLTIALSSLICAVAVFVIGYFRPGLIGAQTLHN